MKNAPRLCFLLLGCLLLTSILGARAQAPTSAAPDPNFHLYLLLGQSNMAGRGPLTEELKAAHHPRVFMLNAAGKWVPARHPLHFDKPAMVGVGPGLAFGAALAEANPNVRIGLVPCAVGGTSITKWQPGAYDEATQTYPYDDAAARITAAMRYGVVRGLLWHQGESDATPDAALAAYVPKLAELIGRVRALTGQPALPVVVGELGRFREANLPFNAALPQVLALVPRTALVSSEGLTDKGDQLHFDSASAEELGRRYAVQVLALQQAASPAKGRAKSRRQAISSH